MSASNTSESPADRSHRAGSGTESAINTRNSPALLFRSGVIVMIGLIAYYGWNAEVAEPVQRYLGIAMIGLSFLPGLAWARRQNTPFPTFQTFMFTGLNSFALPLLGGHAQLNAYPPSAVTTAAWGVVLFQVLAIGSYHFTSAFPRTTPFWTTSIFDRDITSYLRIGMVLTTIYGGVAVLTDIIPAEMVSLLRAIFFGIGTLCTFLLSRSWGAGELAPRDRTLLVVTLSLQAIFLVQTLLLVGGISILVLALLGYVTGGQKIPIIPCVLVFATAVILHNGKSTMRLKYWDAHAPAPAVTDLPGFFSEWIGYGLNPPEIATSDKIASRKLLERTSLLHMLALVVDTTPSRQPFLGGETYAHILPQLVPRLLWPEKPFGHVSTNRLAIYYGLQDEESTYKATIGFGVIAEAYANFGMLGIAGLGLLIGACNKIAATWTRFSPILSYPGLFMILLMAWSFQTELPMSAWIASLYQAAIAVIGVPFALKLILG